VSIYPWIVLFNPLGGIGDFLGRAGGRLVSVPTMFLLMGIGLLIGLDHPARRRIYDHLSRLPGDHLRSVARSLRIAVGTTRYHLDALRREGLIYKRDTNSRARYYVSNGGAEVNRLFARHWEYREVRLRVLDALRRMEDAPPAKIAKHLGVSRQLASYHLASLERAGLARRQGARYQFVVGH
jgi:predicted transcriptional regulator